MSRDKRNLNAALQGLFSGYMAERDRRDKLMEDTRKSQNDLDLYKQKILFANQIQAEQDQRDQEIMNKIMGQSAGIGSEQPFTSQPLSTDISSKPTLGATQDISGLGGLRAGAAANTPSPLMQNLTAARTTTENVYKDFPPEAVNVVNTYDKLINSNIQQLKMLAPQKALLEKQISAPTSAKFKEPYEKKLNKINTQIQDIQDKVEKLKLDKDTKIADFSIKIKEKQEKTQQRFEEEQAKQKAKTLEEQGKLVEKSQKLTSLVDYAEKAYMDLNPGKGLAGKVSGMTKTYLGGKGVTIGDLPKYGAYQAVVQGLAPKISRALDDTGNIAVAERQISENLFPKGSDPYELGMQKINNLRKLQNAIDTGNQKVMQELLNNLKINYYVENTSKGTSVNTQPSSNQATVKPYKIISVE